MDIHVIAWNLAVTPSTSHLCRLKIAEENTRNLITVQLKDVEQVASLIEQLQAFIDGHDKGSASVERRFS